MSDCTAAILPLRIATSLIPSMPEAGQITRPPRSSWSKVALIDMNTSSVFRQSLPLLLPKYEAYFVFDRSKLHAMIRRWRGARIARLAKVFEAWRVRCEKQKSVAAKSIAVRGRCHHGRDF